MQAKHSIPAHKNLSTVRTNATRWSNTKHQVTRNNLMRPIIDPVLSVYRREHVDDTAMIELHTDSDRSDVEGPPPQFAAPSRTLSRKEIRFTEDAWNANLEAEAFLTRPAEIKEILEHRMTVTGAQAVQLVVALMKQNTPTRSLAIRQHPITVSLAHRRRSTTVIEPANLNSLITTAREVLVEQLCMRFVDRRFSDARLIAIYMSKQRSASMILSESNYTLARALYLRWLRLLVTVTTTPGPRRSPRKRLRNLFEGLSDEEEGTVDPDEAEGDQVRAEVRAWEAIAQERIDVFRGSDGLVNEFKLVYSVREELPLHHLLFKQVSSHLGHEANAEDTFSLSGKLSNPNTKTGPGFLASMVRVNKNRSAHDPSSKAVLGAYKKKHRKLPTLGEDVTDDEGSDQGDDACESCEDE